MDEEEVLDEVHMACGALKFLTDMELNVTHDAPALNADLMNSEGD